MKTQLTKIKINGHGYKKGRVWNLAHLLPKRRLALLPDAPATAQPSPDAANPVPEEKPQPSNPPIPQSESASHCVNRKSPIVNALPQPPGAAETADANLKPKIVNLNSPATRVGKIARLPEDVREQVNHMLRHNRNIPKSVKNSPNWVTPG